MIKNSIYTSIDSRRKGGQNKGQISIVHSCIGIQKGELWLKINEIVDKK